MLKIPQNQNTQLRKTRNLVSVLLQPFISIDIQKSKDMYFEDGKFPWTNVLQYIYFYPEMCENTSYGL